MQCPTLAEPPNIDPARNPKLDPAAHYHELLDQLTKVKKQEKR